MDPASFTTPEAIVTLITFILAVCFAWGTVREFRKFGITGDLAYKFAVFGLSLFSAIDFMWVLVPVGVYQVCHEWVPWYSWEPILPWCTLIGALALFVFPIWIPFKFKDAAFLRRRPPTN